MQLERSNVGGACQRGDGNVNWATRLLEKLRARSAIPSSFSQASDGGSFYANLAKCHNVDCDIRDVWNSNIHEEFRVIRKVVQKYTYVAMNTKVLQVVANPIREFPKTADYQYQLLQCNVGLLPIIQLRLTFLDENGNTLPGYTTWQFNFNLPEDMCAQDSIDLLQNSGIQFKKHKEDGIDPLECAALLITSGVVLMDNIKWLCFHCDYDFGYLIKLLTDSNLPRDKDDFFELLRVYFPNVYDVKFQKKFPVEWRQVETIPILRKDIVDRGMIQLSHTDADANLTSHVNHHKE